jgi:hypothetical protein
MTRRMMVWGLVLASLPAGFGLGCGGPSNTPRAVENVELREVADLYRLYIDEYKKPPRRWQDLARYEQGMPLGFNGVKDGRIAVRWGVGLSDTKGEVSEADSPDEVLAYEAKVPTAGGAVLMKDRTVREMTPEEFKAAPKAGGSS